MLKGYRVRLPTPQDEGEGTQTHTKSGARTFSANTRRISAHVAGTFLQDETGRAISEGCSQSRES